MRGIGASKGRREFLTTVIALAIMVQTASNPVVEKVMAAQSEKTEAVLRLHWPQRPWPEGMVWIPAGEFTMGGVGSQARRDEFPEHKVKLDGFWMDETEVTNDQFQKFVAATGYITTAESKPDWNELKKQLPPGTPEPQASSLVPGALVFTPPAAEVKLNDYSKWWKWVPGASWKHPSGPDSSIDGRGQYPVVQVSYDDAQAYCRWAGRQLPTEAQFEYAARGGLEGKIYGWGNEPPCADKPRINFWQGRFPYEKKPEDGYLLSAPVRSFPANGYGLYEIIGNVWEWCGDWYRYDYYSMLLKGAAGQDSQLNAKPRSQATIVNPQGPVDSLDPDEPYAAKRVVRGGSFLCNDSYCASFRPAARMKETPDTGMMHIGFRTVMTDDQWRKQAAI